MSSYDSMLALAREHSFSSFTELQECAFRNEAVYDEQKHLFVVGQTSSGKTLIPLLIYLDALHRARESGAKGPKLLFVVPYRALAAQKLEEMRTFFAKENLNIVQSTGEFRQDDESVQIANVDIAIIINEKVFKYESRDPEFLSQFDFVVLDEVGLIADQNRGVRLDFIIAWAVNQQAIHGRPRVIALGTPFYDWNPYVHSFGFVQIQTKGRPVNLDNVVIDYTDRTLAQKGIVSVEGPCEFLRRGRFLSDSRIGFLTARYGSVCTTCPHLEEKLCPYDLPCRTDPSLNCPKTGLPCTEQVVLTGNKNINVFKYILTSICRHHLEMGHQVLIFFNDRVRVKEICAFLFDELRDLFGEVPPPDVCREMVTGECGLEKDDLFGIMEDQEDADGFYQAFCGGVAFHSRALPNELRTYVEQNLLQSRKLKIVCSTETLAFGVNSSVDVVVIADLMKNDGNTRRALNANEYQNYSGRAGRARRNADLSQLKGYVYTLVRSTQRKDWNQIKEALDQPEELYSCFHMDDSDQIPFFILNMLPDASPGLTAAELAHMLQVLPQDGSISEEEMAGRVEKALDWLQDRQMVAPIQDFSLRKRGEAEPQISYGVTTLGANLRGFILCNDDYDILVNAVNDLVNGIYMDLNRAKFLWKLLLTHHAKNGLNGVFHDSQTRLSCAGVIEYIRSLSQNGAEDLGWLEGCEEQNLFLLGALLAWCEGISAKELYQDFGVHYALLDRIANQIAYLIEIVQEMVPTFMQMIWIKRQEIYRKMHTSSEEYMKQVELNTEKVHSLFVSVFYGINTDVAEEILDYLNRDPDDPDRKQLADELSLHAICPMSARMLRRLIVRYEFFKKHPKTELEALDRRDNLRYQMKGYLQDIAGFGPYIVDFFKETFPDFTFTESEV